jgi:hypothetical protein
LKQEKLQTADFAVSPVARIDRSSVAGGQWSVVSEYAGSKLLGLNGVHRSISALHPPHQVKDCHVR